ncbi:MAG: DUF5696 domain-containing protein [Ruminococcus sp.]|nr:DUF5696 domain-containing protein [Ruminococcus sp.]
MQSKIKKLLAMLLAVGMLTASGATVWAAEGDEEAATETTEVSAPEDAAPGDSLNVDDGIETDASEFKTDIAYRTEQSVIAEMELIAENDRLALYYSAEHLDEEGERDYGPTLCVVDKANGTNWFSSPINAKEKQSVYDETGKIISQYDAPKVGQLNQLKSIIEGVFATPSARSETNINSYRDAKISFEKIDKGFRLTVPMATDEKNNRYITIPVEYTLEADYLKVYVDVKKIKEDYGDNLLARLSFMKAFGAADVDDEGYFVIPDGSGAIIDFNNGKTVNPAYSGMIYGKDITRVPITAANMTRNVSLPMYGIVKNGAGMMAVIDKGDAQASVNAYVSGLNNRVYYNSCYFEFTTRSKDEFTINGTQNDAESLTIYEQYGMKVPEIEVRYYPVADSTGVDYVDIAAKYREYLVTEKAASGNTSAHENSIPLYLDLYGGIIKQESLLGLPVRRSFAITDFDTAKGILEKLNGYGVNNTVVTYENFNAANIKEKVAKDGKPASLLGGKSDFKALTEYAAQTGARIYPSVSNITFRTGSGFNTITDTAIRINAQFSKQTIFDLAHKIPNQYYDELSLLSPLAYNRIYSSLTKSYTDLGYTGIALGDTANTIYGDYGKKFAGREMAKEIIKSGYESFNAAGLSVLADDANGYIIPYADFITNIPLESSGFDIFNRDIPFYQIAMFGFLPVSTTGVNGEPRMGDAILRAVSSGTGLSFDMIGVSSVEVKDTLYDNLFYANQANWVDIAASAWKFENEVLKGLLNTTIIGYEDDGNIIKTTFSDGTEITTNLRERTVIRGSTVYSLYDYIGREVIG